MPLYGYYPPFGLPTPLPHPHAPAAATAPALTAYVDLRSSSLPSDVDYVERMIEYLDWLSKRTPRHMEMFVEAREALITAGHTFETVTLLSDEKFASIGILEGVGLQIRTHVAKFKRVRASGRA